MGMVLPLQRDLLLAPDEHSLTGDFGRTKSLVRKVNIIDIPDTLAICGIVNHVATATTKSATQPAPVEQRFAFVALPDGRAIYADDRPEPLMLGVLNDLHWVYHNGKRTIYFNDGSITFNAANATTDPPFKHASAWSNVDDALGIVSLAADDTEISYDSRPVRASARLEQRLILGSSNLQSGLQNVLVLYPGQHADQTAQCAKRCALDQPDASHRVIKLDDGTEIAVDLGDLTIQVQKVRAAR
jgi:hypothetical protein